VKRILIIDDEEDLTFFIKANLELEGECEVIIANSGKDGIKKAAKHNPDLILLDILMPKMNGYETLEKLKNNIKTLSIPVIMLTALGDDSSKIKAASAYNEDYIVKPVQIEPLKQKIAEVFQRNEELGS